MSRRLCSVVITINDTVLLLMCVYFPTDPQTVALNAISLSLIPDDIQTVIDSVQPTDYIIAGDINCDFSQNTGFVDRLNSYTVDNNLCVLWDKYHVDYTYLHTDQFSTSTIDHFIMTNNIYNVCSEGHHLYKIVI